MKDKIREMINRFKSEKSLKWYMKIIITILVTAFGTALVAILGYLVAKIRGVSWNQGISDVMEFLAEILKYWNERYT